MKFTTTTTRNMATKAPYTERQKKFAFGHKSYWRFVRGIHGSDIALTFKTYKVIILMNILIKLKQDNFSSWMHGGYEQNNACKVYVHCVCVYCVHSNISDTIAKFLRHDRQHSIHLTLSIRWMRVIAWVYNVSSHMFSRFVFIVSLMLNEPCFRCHYQ